jgi:hypothetical protein
LAHRKAPAQLTSARVASAASMRLRSADFSIQTENLSMPEISWFFGIIIRMFFDDHDPPHVHAEYSGSKAVFDFRGNVIKGDLGSRTATKLVREWIDFHLPELEEDWQLARNSQALKKIAPLQ